MPKKPSESALPLKASKAPKSASTREKKASSEANKPSSRAGKASSVSEPKRRKDGVATRERILDVARALIRKKGFDAASMREIASRAEVSLGLAYHYFASKDAIPMALYAEHITKHAELAREALKTRTDLAERIETAMLTGLDARANDRAVLKGMARSALDFDSSASLFAKETSALRDASIALFREVVERDEVLEELRGPLALALWSLHLGVLLRFVHDESPGQKETRLLIEKSARLVRDLVFMLGLPFVEPLRASLLDVLTQGGLLNATLNPHAVASTIPTHGTNPADATTSNGPHNA
jgi:AcrR family transcriptional regulator